MSAPLLQHKKRSCCADTCLHVFLHHVWGFLMCVYIFKDIMIMLPTHLIPRSVFCFLHSEWWFNCHPCCCMLRSLMEHVRTCSQPKTSPLHSTLILEPGHQLQRSQACHQQLSASSLLFSLPRPTESRCPTCSSLSDMQRVVSTPLFHYWNI